MSDATDTLLSHGITLPTAVFAERLNPVGIVEGGNFAYQGRRVRRRVARPVEGAAWVQARVAEQERIHLEARG